MLRYLLCTFAACLLSLTMAAGRRYGSDSLRWGILRALIKERDGYRCRECKAKAEYGGVWIEVHHHQPVSEGGSYAPWNLVSLCKRCHTKEHAR